MEHPMESEFMTVLQDGRDISYIPHTEEVSYADLASKSTSKYLTPPVDLAWKDLTFSVPMKKTKSSKTDPKAELAQREKVVLQNMSGEVRSGQMLAVMGSSGAGKTSLLNLLAGRVTTSKGAKASGTVLVNGEARDYTKFRKISAYVLQDDDMFAELTVREQIAYAAMLRLPKNMSHAHKMARVDRVIQELGLAKVKNSFLGGPLVRGVSGGERKRVNIGTELVTDPALLFLDEPTTGLDSFNALNVMQSLRHLASAGRTVVSTIHQPRSSIYSLFDQLILLSEGRVMYMGPAKDAVSYFSSLNFRSPANFNPADFFLDLLSVDPRSPEREATTLARIKYIGDKHEAVASYPVSVRKSAEIEENGGPGLLEPATNEPELSDSQFQTSWWKEFVILTGRSLKLASRERTSNGIRLGQVIFFSVLLGLIWLSNGRKNSLKDQASLGGVLFFIVINQSFGGVFSVIFQFPLERSVVTRERASNMYRTSSYFLSKTMTDFPKTLTFNLLFSVITYWMIGLRADAGAFFQFVLVLFLVSTFAESLALAISVMTGDPQSAASLIPVFVIIAMLLYVGGFFIESDALPTWLGWMKYLSFIYYGTNALANAQFPPNSPGNSIVGQVRNRFGYSSVDYWVDVGALVGLTLLMKVLGYLFLNYLRGPKYLKF